MKYLAFSEATPALPQMLFRVLEKIEPQEPPYMLAICLVGVARIRIRETGHFDSASLSTALRP